MTLGALAFLNPWLLAALATLPLIYWLLRTVPPRPRQIAFPATRILVGIENKEKTPAKTPWWLMLIRLLAAALVIAALAEPVLNPSRDQALKGNGPVVAIVDNGWAGATGWAERTAMLERVIAEAEAQSRPVVVLPTAMSAKSWTARIETARDARTTAAALKPQPHAPDRAQALSALERPLAAAKSGVSIVWLTDGIDHGESARSFADRLAEIASSGTLAVFETPQGREPLGVVAGAGRGGKLEAAVLRAAGPAREGMLHAYSVRGQRLAETPFRLAAGDTRTSVTFELPLELRNQVTRVEIASERSAGAVSLLDARSSWHRVGLVSGESREQAQPLLAPLYYIRRALAPFAEMVDAKDANLAAAVDQILKQNATALVLADIGTLSGAVKERIESWVKQGGVLVRFAGPRLEKGGDDLLPVPLRTGGRSLGGALSWSTPQPVAPFDQTGLFSGLSVPADVTVNRQVLADPARLGPGVKVWARLKDGTPLVTAAKLGEGEVVLFHVTANSDWSSLPMSGLFVDMLQRIVTLGKSGAGSGEAATAADGSPANAPADVLAPTQTLDGFGTLRAPPPTAQGLAAAQLGDLKPSLDHPPGYYGPAGASRALNVLDAKATLAPLPALPARAERRTYDARQTTPLKPHLLAAALALLLVDVVAILLLQAGGSLFSRRAATATVLLLAFSLIVPFDAQAQGRTAPTGRDAIAQKATGKVSFAYVLTGDDGADTASRLGLSGLNKILGLRTAVEPGEPIGVDIVSDEIAFYPIVYWPVLPSARSLSEATLAKIDAYMKQGGMLIFDTKDFGQGGGGGLGLALPGGAALQRLLGTLDIPRLEPVPDGHVLTKSFYLLKTFPGRWDGGQLWVEAESGEPSQDTSRKARRVDGVSSILITSNDLASAWALDERGRPIYPTVPGGEPQREQAFRTGVNIVMYALTGNYKADQVHVPALLERLGQ